MKKILLSLPARNCERDFLFYRGGAGCCGLGKPEPRAAGIPIDWPL